MTFRRQGAQNPSRPELHSVGKIRLHRVSCCLLSPSRPVDVIGKSDGCRAHNRNSGHRRGRVMAEALLTATVYLALPDCDEVVAGTVSSAGPSGLMTGTVSAHVLSPMPRLGDVRSLAIDRGSRIHGIADLLQPLDTAQAVEGRHHVPMLPFVTGDDPDWLPCNSATPCVNGCNNPSPKEVREHHMTGFVQATRTTLRKKYERHRRTSEKQ